MFNTSVKHGSTPASEEHGVKTGPYEEYLGLT